MCNVDGAVFGVFTATLTHFLAKTIFFWRVYLILVTIRVVVRGVIFVFKKLKF